MTAIADFDPDRFISSPEPAKVAPLRDMPAEWAHGLTLLADRGLPRGASEKRWKQIVNDAASLGSRYLLPVVAAGWSIENLFGFDPDEINGELSLAVFMQGRLLLHIDDKEAWLKSPGRMAFFRPRMPAGSALLWNFNDRLLGK